MILESGAVLKDVRLRYTTLGKYQGSESRVVWIFHPLTCDSNPANWWPEFVGEGKVIDPNHSFIICVNALGSCYGSSGPSAEIDGLTAGLDFPIVTIKDIVRAFQVLKESLGIQKIDLGIGGSFGGQQLLEWLAADPDAFAKACVIGANAKQSPWAIAFNETQRMALEADADFTSSAPHAGAKGLAAARAIAILSYRTYETYGKSQGEESDAKHDQFKAASYQRYIGQKFTARFDAKSYWYLTKAMDSHNIARSRRHCSEVLASIETRILLLSLKGDVLFPEEEMRELARGLPYAQYHSIDSTHGHDGILANADLILAQLELFLNQTTLCMRVQSL
ncbi:MAG: homoserine O-acetyltransferase [Proteobacteria bacterium]|nr:MAG: homoserine O-acetyltransferase [Pseudomonadota bacterium]